MGAHSEVLTPRNAECFFANAQDFLWSEFIHSLIEQ